MIQMTQTRSRLDLFVELNHFFEAYFALTEQMGSAVEREQLELITRLIELRRQTQLRVDTFLSEHPNLLDIQIDEESDSLVIKTRKHIRDLVTKSQGMSDKFLKEMTILHARQRKQANDLAKGQRGLRGYTQNRKKKSVYVESTK